MRAADLVVVGAPCADHTHINPRRDPTSARAQVLFDALDVVIENVSKVAVFEVVLDFVTMLSDDFVLFCERSSHTHEVHPILMDPMKFGGVQTRKRWYLVLVCKDIAAEKGPFHAPPMFPSTRVLLDVLQPVHELDMRALIDDRPWKRRWTTDRASSYAGAISNQSTHV